jgi:hypothetical protein
MSKNTLKILALAFTDISSVYSGRDGRCCCEATPRNDVKCGNAMTLANLKVNDRVHDAWWPYRLGVVTKKTRGTVTVKWVAGMDGVPPASVYDRHHVKFLVREV